MKDRFRSLIHSPPPSVERLIPSGSLRSVVGLVTVLQGFESWKGRKILLFSTSPDQLCSSPSLLLNRYRHCFPGVKAAERVVNRLYSAEVKNEWSCAGATIYTFTAGTGTTLPVPPLASRSALCVLFLVTKLVEPLCCWVLYVVSYAV